MNRYREARIRTGLSQKAAAISLGVKPPSMSDWERGKSQPKQSHLVAMAALYHTTTDYLTGAGCNKLRFCRESRNMSQKYVALSVGVSPPMVSQWESGIKEPSKETLIKLADLFHVTVDYLLNREPETEATQLSEAESRLLYLFRSLNQTGQAVALRQAEALLDLPELATHVQETGSAPSADPVEDLPDKP